MESTDDNHFQEQIKAEDLIRAVELKPIKQPNISGVVDKTDHDHITSPPINHEEDKVDLMEMVNLKQESKYDKADKQKDDVYLVTPDGYNKSSSDGKDIFFFKPNREETSFTCDICKSSFAIKTRLRRHMRVHTGEKPFTCNVCTKSFTQKYYLSTHMRVHTGERPFPCNVCEMSFMQKSNLLSHLQVHSKKRSFACNICNKTFVQKYSLQRHMTTHTGEKPFKCNICNKSFTLKSNVLRHVRVHTGEKSSRNQGVSLQIPM